MAAVEPVTRRWPPQDRAKAAAIFDVLWDVVSYERLVSEWQLAPRDAISALTWAVGLVEDAVRQNRRPVGERDRRPRAGRNEPGVDRDAAPGAEESRSRKPGPGRRRSPDTRSV